MCHIRSYSRVEYRSHGPVPSFNTLVRGHGVSRCCSATEATRAANRYSRTEAGRFMRADTVNRKSEEHENLNALGF
jgi:hypothetical protein